MFFYDQNQNLLLYENISETTIDVLVSYFKRIIYNDR